MRASKSVDKTCWCSLTDVNNQFIGIREQSVPAGFSGVEPHVFNVPATLDVCEFVDVRLPVRCVSDAGIRNKNQTTRLGAFKQKACLCSNCEDGVHTYPLDPGRLPTNERRNDREVITEMNFHDYGLDEMKTGGTSGGNWMNLLSDGGIFSFSEGRENEPGQ